MDNNSRIRLTNNGLAYVFQEAVLATTSGSNLEHNKLVGQISIIMRVLTNRDLDFLSQFNNINEGDTVNDFDTTSFKKMLLDNLNTAGKEIFKGKMKGQLPLKHFFGFCKTFKKVTKILASI